MVPQDFPIGNELELREYFRTHRFPDMNYVRRFPIRNELELREYFRTHDPLTLLRNRRSLRNEFSKLRGDFEDVSTTALFLVDLDGFKNNNDRYGMRAADEVLIETALRLRDVFESRLLARYGGDEFVGIARGPMSLSTASVIAERIVEAFRVPFQIAAPGMSIDVIQSVSLGVVLWNSPLAQFETILKEADLALSEAKAHGGDPYVIHASDVIS